MATEEKPGSDNDALFEGMIEASGVKMSAEEKQKLRAAHSALMVLAERARPRQKPNSWEVRMAPFFAPKSPPAHDK